MQHFAPTWRLRALDKALVAKLSLELGVSPLLARLLINRGVSDLAEAHRFLGHDPYELNPWAMPGIERASHRLLTALDSGESVVVYGDYDADGVTSTTLLYSYLARSGYDAHYFLPHRFEDGYGMNRHALHDLAERGFRLIVTVDNGISSVEEAEYARSLGMDLIITDHHTPPEALPEAYALLNPRLGGCPPEMAGLAGVGVAFILASALEELAPSGGVEDLLDLVAIGSIADMAPLQGLNRTLVGRGLYRMATDPRPGIQALADVAGISSLASITASDIGFKIAPRINAAGRMEHCEIGLKLLLAETITNAEPFAFELDRLNRLRQETSQRIEREARRRVEADADLARDPALVLAQEDWHHGVIGIVASRLIETYGRPVVLLAGDGDRYRGSGRSPETIDLFRALEGASEHLIRWGGHAQAVGLTVERDRLEAFRQRLSNSILAQGLAEPPVHDIDAEVSLAELTPQLIRELAWLQPTGHGNPDPVLALRDVTVTKQKVRGKDGRHLFLELQEGLEIREAVGFGMAHLHPVPKRVSLAFTPEFNHFLGQTKVQLRLHAVASPGELMEESPS